MNPVPKNESVIRTSYDKVISYDCSSLMDDYAITEKENNRRNSIKGKTAVIPKLNTRPGTCQDTPNNVKNSVHDQFN